MLGSSVAGLGWKLSFTLSLFNQLVSLDLLQVKSSPNKKLISR